MTALKSAARLLAAAAIASFVTAAPAQDARPSYGPAIRLDDAKKIAAGVMAEAKKNNWAMAVAIVDNHGMLIYYEMMDDTQTASAVIAVEKAKSSAMFRRSTRVMEDTVNKGRTSFLGIPLATPIAGGLAITAGGKVVGGVGVSGGTSDQDEQCAKAGLAGV